jgi:ATP-dependent HslUV protease subunit HslV
MELHGTTILAVQRDGRVAMAGDGQVTISPANIVLKHHAQKVRRLSSGKVLAGFAGSLADSISLYDKFEAKMEEYRGNLLRAAVELARDWRSDRVLRRLEAQMLVADATHVLLLSGSGEVIEPDEPVLAIGSGGPYALAAAQALVRHTAMPAAEIVRAAMRIAADICVYTNTNFVVEEL